MSDPFMSRRGAALVASPPLPEYIGEHFARCDPPWHPEHNANGYVGMCIAENKLMNDLLLPKLSEVGVPPEHVLGYDAMIGNLDFRTKLADFMSTRFLGRAVAPEHVAVLAGAGTVLETLFYVLADPGDAVLVPTPSYAGFWADLCARDGLEIVTIDTSSDDEFRLTTGQLDAALSTAERPVRALLFTTPDNPMGRVYTGTELESVLQWAEANEIHVVFDEVYALSVFGDQAFTSAASLRPSLGDRAHIVWAFSKDFGASGLRCGVLISENEAVMAAVDGLAYWGCVSGHTQWLLHNLVSDDAWVDHYLGELRRRLGDAYSQVSQALNVQGIAHVPADAGIFVLCDVRNLMDDVTWEAEERLWRRLLEVGNVNLTPGSACHIAEPGFLRLCYAAGATEAIVAGIERLALIRHQTGAMPSG
ncbi:MAG TPA: aminotransferase class I/II-fold pyridoxal phosphate-dependent enzyme [Acidimicrobiia bacterium]|nr:aminotransferase class I/II-fold pyridoxal phosphate-dependent enzyme [Acidimicrobiia bacterium]